MWLVLIHFVRFLLILIQSILVSFDSFSFILVHFINFDSICVTGFFLF